MSAPSKTNVSRKTTKEELREEFQRVARELDTTPTQPEIRDHAKYSVSTYRRRYDSWMDAVKDAGMFPVRSDGATRDDLEEEMRNVAEKVGHPPTKKEMNELGRISERTYLREYGDWLTAREAAGFDGKLQQPNKRASKEELLEALLDLAEDLGRTPKASEMTEKGRHSHFTYQHRFGSWNDALREADLELVYDPDTAEFEPYYGQNWHEQRQQALERDNYECRVCGLTEEQHQAAHEQSLHVHHIKPLRTFDDPEDANTLDNLVALCKGCHNRWEGIPLRPQRVGGGADE